MRTLGFETDSRCRFELLIVNGGVYPGSVSLHQMLAFCDRSDDESAVSDNAPKFNAQNEAD